MNTYITDGLKQRIIQSHLALDFVSDLPSSQGNTVILTIVDRFSEMCQLIPLPKFLTVSKLAELLMDRVFSYYSLPEDIVWDRGP